MRALIVRVPEILPKHWLLIAISPLLMLLVPAACPGAGYTYKATQLPLRTTWTRLDDAGTLVGGSSSGAIIRWADNTILSLPGYSILGISPRNNWIAGLTSGGSFYGQISDQDHSADLHTIPADSVMSGAKSSNTTFQLTDISQAGTPVGWIQYEQPPNLPVNFACIDGARYFLLDPELGTGRNSYVAADLAVNRFGETAIACRYAYMASSGAPGTAMDSYPLHDAFRGSRDGAITPLPPLAGSFRYGAQANDINDSSEIVGWSSTGSGRQHATLWDSHDDALDLQPRDWNANSIANAINQNRIVVGTVTTNSLDSAFVWSNRLGMRDLNTTGIAANLNGWRLTSALDVNGKGQILARGTKDGATSYFLLNPGRVYRQVETAWINQHWAPCVVDPYIEAIKDVNHADHKYYADVDYAEKNNLITIGTKGCLLTCYAMVLSRLGVDEVTPLQLHEAYNTNALFGEMPERDGVSSVSKTTKVPRFRDPGANLYDLSSLYSEMKCRELWPENGPLAAALKTAIGRGKEVVLNVKDGGHFILVDDVNGDQFSFVDPGTLSGNATSYLPGDGPRTLDDPFLAVKKAKILWSDPTPHCTLNVHSPVEVVITSPSGKRLGFDPRSGTYYCEIGESSYGVEYPIGDLEGPYDAPETLSRAALPKVGYVNVVEGGKYHVQVIGVGDGGDFSLYFTKFATQSAPESRSVAGTVVADQVLDFDFDVSLPLEDFLRRSEISADPATMVFFDPITGMPIAFESSWSRVDRFQNCSTNRRLQIDSVQGVLLDPAELGFSDITSTNAAEIMGAAFASRPDLHNLALCWGDGSVSDSPAMEFYSSPQVALPIVLEPGEEFDTSTLLRVFGMSAGEWVVGWRFTGSVEMVPEPGAFVLLATGLVGLLIPFARRSQGRVLRRSR